MPDFDLLRDLVIFACLFLGTGFGLPIPEEITIVAAGLWTAGKALQYPQWRWIMLPVCLVAIIVADVVLYGIGRLFGTRLLEHSWMARFVPADKRRRIEGNFHHYGVNILLFGRLLPGIRAPLFVTAGTMKLSIPRFLLADGLGAVLGNTLLFFLAFWFGDQFKELVEGVEGEVNKIKPVIIMLAILGVAAFFLYNFWRRPVPTGDPEELPLIGHQVAAHIDQVSTPRQASAEPAAEKPAEKNASPDG